MQEHSYEGNCRSCGDNHHYTFPTKEMTYREFMEKLATSGWYSGHFVDYCKQCDSMTMLDSISYDAIPDPDKSDETGKEDKD